MKSLVTAILSLQRDLSRARADHDRTVVERHIRDTDAKIDLIICELFGLRPSQVSIVLGSAVAPNFVAPS